MYDEPTPTNVATKMLYMPKSTHFVRVLDWLGAGLHHMAYYCVLNAKNAPYAAAHARPHEIHLALCCFPRLPYMDEEAMYQCATMSVLVVATFVSAVVFTFGGKIPFHGGAPTATAAIGTISIPHGLLLFWYR